MQARPAVVSAFYLLQPGKVRLPHSVQWRSPCCSVQRCVDSSDPSPYPGHAAVGSLRLQAPGARGLDVHPCVSASSVRRPEGPAARCRTCSPSGPWHVPYGSIEAQPIRPVERPGCPHIYLMRQSHSLRHTPPGGLVGAAHTVSAQAGSFPLLRRLVPQWYLL